MSIVNSATGPAYVSNLVPMLPLLGLVVTTVPISNPSSALNIENYVWLLLWCMPGRCWARSLVVWVEMSTLMLVGLTACSAKSTDLWRETDKVAKGFVTLSLLFAMQTLNSCCVGSQFWLHFAVRCCSPSPVASSKACLSLPVPGALDQLRRVWFVPLNSIAQDPSVS